MPQEPGLIILYDSLANMGRKKFVVLQVFLALLLLAACASPPERVLSANAPSYATLPNGYEPLNPAQPSPIYAEVTAIPGDNLIRYLERKSGHGSPSIRDKRLLPRSSRFSGGLLEVTRPTRRIDAVGAARSVRSAGVGVRRVVQSVARGAATHPS